MWKLASIVIALAACTSSEVHPDASADRIPDVDASSIGDAAMSSPLPGDAAAPSTSVDSGLPFAPDSSAPSTCSEAVEDLRALSASVPCATADDCALIGTYGRPLWFTVRPSDRERATALYRQADRCNCCDGPPGVAQCIAGLCEVAFDWCDADGGFVRSRGPDDCSDVDGGG